MYEINTSVDALTGFQNQLSSALGEGEAKATMRLLVEDLFDKNWDRLNMLGDSLSDEQIARLKGAVARILDGEPPQHITGKAWFYGRAFYVDKHVLIPRRETEELVEWILKDWQNRAWKGLDLGTGSGCIPITLQCEASTSQMTAIDVSDEALEVAGKNARSNNVSIDFLKMDMLHPDLNAFSNLDVLVSNPPYVLNKERDEMAVRVKDYEPALALFVPDDEPLLFYKALAKLADTWLRIGGKAYCEIHESFGKETAQVFREAGFGEIEIKKDMQGKDRMIRVTKGSK